MFMILLTSTNNKINDFIDTRSSLKPNFRLLFCYNRRTFTNRFQAAFYAPHIHPSAAHPHAHRLPSPARPLPARALHLHPHRPQLPARTRAQSPAQQRPRPRPRRSPIQPPTAQTTNRTHLQRPHPHHRPSQPSLHPTRQPD